MLPYPKRKWRAELQRPGPAAGRISRLGSENMQEYLKPQPCQREWQHQKSAAYGSRTLYFRAPGRTRASHRGQSALHRTTRQSIAAESVQFAGWLVGGPQLGGALVRLLHLLQRYKFGLCARLSHMHRRRQGSRQKNLCTAYILRCISCRLTDSEQLQPPSLLTLPIQVNKPPTQQIHKQVTKPGKDPKQRGDFYANVGEAIRVLRAEIPLLFQKDLTCELLSRPIPEVISQKQLLKLVDSPLAVLYKRIANMHGSLMRRGQLTEFAFASGKFLPTNLLLFHGADDIYRDDITFRDPRNTFQGKKDYKTIFWSLRFHGRLFFRLLYVDVLRIWESPENVKDAGTVLK